MRQAEQGGTDPGQYQRQPDREVVSDAPLAYPAADVSDTEKREGEGRRQGRDAYDWFVLAIAALALLAAAAAAWFTWEQAAVAREQTRRSLRAYVVVEAELATGREGGWPVVRLKAENMGQTPVYDLVYLAGTDSVSTVRRDPLPNPGLMRADCSAWEGGWQGFITTFSKAFAEDRRITRGEMEVPTVEEAFAEANAVYGYGTACYRDIFGDAHAFRFCFRWHRSDAEPGRCDTRMQ